jgi:hypothetical protein
MAAFSDIFKLIACIFTEMAIYSNHQRLGVYKLFKNRKPLKFLGDRTSHTRIRVPGDLVPSVCSPVLKACLQCVDQNATESVVWAQFTDQIQLDLWWYKKTPLIRKLVIRIGLALRVNLSRILQN